MIATRKGGRRAGPTFPHPIYSPAGSEEGVDHFGDKIDEAKVNSDTIRLAFINIKGLGSFKTHCHTQQLRALLQNNHIDVLGVVEPNINWSRLLPKHRIHARTKGWFKNLKIQSAYNIHDRRKSIHQFGGSQLWALNDLVFRIQANKTDHDETGLGRWTSMRIIGANRRVVRIVSAYAPHDTVDSKYTVAAQHMQYFQETAPRQELPNAAFWTDLGTKLKAWQEAGEAIILMADCN